MNMAIDSPTMDEPLAGTAAGLAMLYAEVSGFMPSDSLAASVPSEAIAQHSQLLAESIEEHQGHIIKAIGSCVMAEFASPLAAVHAAVVMERLLAEYKQTSSQNDQKGLRVGIHYIADSSQRIDLFGSIAHVAASITKHASSGRILVSREVCDALSSERDFHFQWFQKVSIDGLKDNLDIFEVRWTPSATGIPPRYEGMFQVGMGGMGIVYKVRDRETNEIVALKVLRSEIAADPAMKENLKREVCLARRVTHKNVCRIHEFNRSNDTAYISMEFVEGESLLSALQRSGSLPWNEALKIVRQICAGLGEAHAQGIVHRDLKPANIMIDRTGLVKIMDFGIARPFQVTGQMTCTLVGTPAYMAPEQLELRNTDARTDVYALGLMLYEIVTGTPAFDGDTPIAVALKQLRESPEIPQEIASTLPPHAEALILKCIEKDPAKRFQNVDELAVALRNTTRTKPVVSLWAEFAADMRRAGHDLYRDLQPRVEAINQFIWSQNWASLTKTNSRKSWTFGLGAAFLFSAVILFAVTRTTKNPTAASVTVGTSPDIGDRSLQSLGPHTLAVGSSSPEGPTLAGAGLPASRYKVQHVSGSSLISKDIVASSHLDASSSALPSRSTRANRAEKARPAVRIPLPAKATNAATLPVTTQPTLQPPATVDSPAPVTPTETATEPEVEVGSDLSTSVVPTIAPATNVETASEGNITDAVPTSALRFFDVGSFKDPAWADLAVEKLTQLGFQAVSVRKNKLWVRSYQVRVGPFTDLQACEAARVNLISQGFKPQPVK